MAERSRRQVKKNLDLQHIIFKEKERSQMRQIRKILKKPTLERTEEELKLLDNVPELVHQIEITIMKNTCLKERTKEIYDEEEVLIEKCEQLAKALEESSYTVVYTGAGISTSAQIPDYRGPNGVWTLLQKGKDISFKDLSLAEPTFTHMALQKLHREGFISHIVSQNCDGLHLRSGIPKAALSELHGNMFIEVCPKCKPLKQYIRLFDVTEKTALHKHKTGRFCKKCRSELKDTIVHFGEKGTLPWPMNWKAAVKAASKAQLILCLGTSLKVLRRYQSLWATDKPHEKRPKLYIVNLQWTPKDPQSTLKIHGKCDDVMKKVISFLGITVPKYEKENDPIFQMAVPLNSRELSTTTRQFLCKEPNVKTSSQSEISVTNSPIQEDSLDLVEKQDNADQKDNLLTETINTSKNTSHLKTDSCQNSDSESPENMDKSMNTTSGWYGKGCAKLRKKRKVMSSKRMKQEYEE